jgi:hypothetical protein
VSDTAAVWLFHGNTLKAGVCAKQQATNRFQTISVCVSVDIVFEGEVLN